MHFRPNHKCPASLNLRATSEKVPVPLIYGKGSFWRPGHRHPFVLWLFFSPYHITYLLSNSYNLCAPFGRPDDFEHQLLLVPPESSS